MTCVHCGGYVEPARSNGYLQQPYLGYQDVDGHGPYCFPCWVDSGVGRRNAERVRDGARYNVLPAMAGGRGGAWPTSLSGRWRPRRRSQRSGIGSTGSIGSGISLPFARGQARPYPTATYLAGPNLAPPRQPYRAKSRHTLPRRAITCRASPTGPNLAMHCLDIHSIAGTSQPCPT